MTPYLPLAIAAIAFVIAVFAVVVLATAAKLLANALDFAESRALELTAENARLREEIEAMKNPPTVDFMEPTTVNWTETDFLVRKAVREFAEGVE